MRRPKMSPRNRQERQDEPRRANMSPRSRQERPNEPQEAPPGSPLGASWGAWGCGRRDAGRGWREPWFPGGPQGSTNRFISDDGKRI